MSVWEIAHWSSQNKHHFDIHVGNFLDEFYRSNTEDRAKMVSHEPKESEQLDSYMLPFLAAMVHKLCNDYGIVCPDWVHKLQYVLKEPYFPLNAQGRLRQLLMNESPPEFRVRNLYPSANCLTRV